MVSLSQLLYSVQPPLLFKLLMFSCLFSELKTESKKQPGNLFGKLFQFVLLFMSLRVFEFTLRRAFCSGLGTWGFFKKKKKEKIAVEVPDLLRFLLLFIS